MNWVLFLIIGYLLAAVYLGVDLFRNPDDRDERVKPLKIRVLKSCLIGLFWFPILILGLLAFIGESFLYMLRIFWEDLKNRKR